MLLSFKNVLIAISVLINLYWFSTLSIFQKEEEPWFLSIYTTDDIIHVYNNKIEFESDSTQTEFFENWEEVQDRVEELTSNASVITGYQEDLKYNIQQGYISLEIHPALTDKGDIIKKIGSIHMHYYGPNWALNPRVDTSFLIESFYHIDEFNAEYDEDLTRTYKMYVARKY